MPDYVFFLARHAAIGMGLAVLFVALVAGLDLGHLGHLGTLVRGGGGWLALGALTAVVGLTFASAQMGMAIMSLGSDERGSGGGRDPWPTRAQGRSVPATARVTGRPARVVQRLT